MGLFTTSPVELDDELRAVLVLPERKKWRDKEVGKKAQRYWNTLDQGSKNSISIVLCTTDEGIVALAGDGLHVEKGVWRGSYNRGVIRNCRSHAYHHETWAVVLFTLTVGKIFFAFDTQREAGALVAAIHGL